MTRMSGYVPSALIALGVLGAVITLQGCSRDTYESTTVNTPITLEEEGHVPPQVYDDSARCDDVATSQSQAFQEQIQQDAPEYFKGVKDKFSDNFVQYPFCLQMDAFVVDVMKKEMSDDTAYEGLPTDKSEELMNETVKDLYFKHADTWMKMCQDWADHNKRHQMFNLKMVRDVLDWDKSDAELKKQIAAYYNWQPWWTFFSQIMEKGCVRRYTQRCSYATEAARANMRRIVNEKTGNAQMRWTAFDDGHNKDTGNGNPPESQSLMQEGALSHEEGAYDGGQVYVAEDDTRWNSLPQAKRHLQQRFLVPVELKAGGQQFRTRERPHNTSHA